MQQVGFYAEATPSPRRRSLIRSNLVVGILLILTMLIGGYFRYVGLNWDDFAHLHPDERFLTQVVVSLGGGLNPSESSADSMTASLQIEQCLSRYPNTGGAAPLPQGYFDALCSTLNPHNAGGTQGLYVYGTLPLFIARGTADLVARWSEWWAHNVQARTDPEMSQYDGSQWRSYDGAHLIWRYLSAASEIGVILIVFLIGVKLHNKWVGLLAALLYAATIFSIQLAHFGTTDAMSNFFAALTILFAVYVQREGRLGDYILCGAAFGAAIASRINLLPLIGLPLLAAFVQAIPFFDRNAVGGERIIAKHLLGIILTGIVAFLVFRVTNPYAFMGPGFFGLSLNPRWFGDLGTAQALISGTIDSPPNFQWVARTPYLFPLTNIVLWGMGIPLGIAAWASFVWSLWRIIRGKPGALANLLLIAWVAVYFGYMGRQWVTTMRYFIPIYPALVVLAAWGILEVVRRAKLATRLRPVRLTFASAVLILVAGFTVLWAAMFTNIYRHMLTRVQASHWVWENVPGDFAMRVNADTDDLPMINVGIDNNGLGGRITLTSVDPFVDTTFTAPATGTLTTLDVAHLDDPENDSGEETLRISLLESLGGEVRLLSQTTFAGDTTFDYAETAIPYTLALDAPVPVQEGQSYILRFELVDGESVALGGVSMPVMPSGDQFFTSGLPLINIGIPGSAGDERDLVGRLTRFDQFRLRETVQFTAPGTGTITSIHAPHLGDPNDDLEAETLRFAILRMSDSAVLAQATLSTNLTRETNVTGDTYDIPLDRPLHVEQGQEYMFQVDLVDGGPVVSGGSIFTWEGAWDDPIPVALCGIPNGLTLADDPPPGLLMDKRECDWHDPWFGLVNGYTQDMVYEDVEEKRQFVLETLDNSDYIAISSNRFYDTLNRNPARWPMTKVYYDALFGGELGYELVATFQETYELGPLSVSDQYLPTYDGPEILNEFEAEEAFSVYDHPVVFIFRKMADYNPSAVETVLYNVPITRVYEAPVFNNCPEDPDLYYCDPTLVNVATVESEDAAKAPTMLWLTDEMREMQYNNGTWSARFDSSSPVNTNNAVTIAAWWIVIVLCGFATWPLLFTLLPALADRGYAFAKFMGMFLVGWATWYLASVRIPIWSQAGILGGLIILFVVGLILLWRVRREFIQFLRKHWGRLLVIEVITLAAFLFFLAIRLTNPDLWHDTFGGEKPMNFAYFNAVLRSTIFPPYDPWYSGGFLNYYYFGYVIVGTPTLLLKMMPSIAYNLILPTLYATAGIGAFSVAFSIVNTLRERAADGVLRRLGSPYVAGVAALVLAMVLGNLDTPRVALSGLATAGGYTRMDSLEEFLVQEYTRDTGAPPDELAMLDLLQRAQQNRLDDRLRYEVKTAADIVSALVRGAAALANGGGLSVNADRWFWGPSRILSEPPVSSGGAITEMPFFTFIYGDLHAHMISMPMQFFLFAFVLNEVLLARDDKRGRWIRWLALAVGGITVGMLRATNTWDWITYLLLGAAALGFAWWLRWSEHSRSPFSRRALVDFVGRVGGFVAVTFVAVLPFTTWYTSTYNRVLLWEGNRTPFWAYFDIHGLFLFLIFSLLLWETGRWLRSVKVRTLRGKFEPLLALVLIVLGLVFLAFVLSAMSYQVTLIALPLLVWTAVLFFRQGQSRVMQYVLALMGLGLGLTLGVEYIVLDGDVGRQNTVFKFYMQVWLMFSVVGGAAFAWLIRSIWRWKPGVRTAWLVTLAALVTIALLFPIMAARAKAFYRMPPVANEDGTIPDIPFTLDGASFMHWARRWEGDNDVVDMTEFRGFTLEEDYEMIRWLQENIQGTPTIIEGLGDDTQYRWNGRISIYTGLPAVLGWNFHQRQQRTLDPMGRIVEMRNANINAFYETHSIGTAWQILQFYEVDYIIVGKMERAYYNREGLEKFNQMVDEGLLEVVWQQGDSIVYRVNHDAQLTERG